MSRKMDKNELYELLKNDQAFAVLDVREHGEYSLGHIPGASPLPRGELEFRASRIVPWQDIPVVVYCDDGRRSEMAARTMESMGYCRVSVLAGGFNSWKESGLPVELGIKSHGKEAAERLSIETGVPELKVEELLERQRAGEQIYIIDTRMPGEFQLGHIPGAFNVPGGQLPLETEFIAVVRNATIVTCCAGRTRSMMGAYILRQMGLPNVYALTNGVLSWAAAGLSLEKGPEPSAIPPAGDQKVRSISASELKSALEGPAPPTLIDLRPKGLFAAGHIRGSCWLPRGLLELRLREMIPGQYIPVVYCCETGLRSLMASETTLQMGLTEVFVLQGGITSWSKAGLPLEIGFQGLDEVTPADINEMVHTQGPEAVPREGLRRAMKEKMNIFQRVKEHNSL